jgi:hypothetical protein
VSCRECEELIVTAAREGRTLEAAAEHLAQCGACGEFAKEAAVIVSALANWRAPMPAEHAMNTAYAVLLDRRAARNRREASGLRNALVFLPAPPTRMVLTHAHPALLVLPGAAAVAVGLAMVPDWARAAAACWAAISTALVTVVLLVHGRPIACEGE